ncbi:hypothetical protein ACHWQZ_G018178 [Mnemiopsis leidyi]
MLTKSVELVRGEAGFGFSVIGGSDTYLPPMVFTLAPNKAAHSSGQVEKGDRILDVNGVSVSDVPSKKVIQLINESGSTLRLSLQDDPDLKRRLNAFMQAKERSGNAAPAPAATPVTKAEVSPVKTVISPSSGRRLYQPRSYSSLPNGAAPQKKAEPAPAKKPEPPPGLEPPKSVEEDSRLQYNIPADKSPNVSASSEKYRVSDEHLYNDLDTARGNSGVKQTSLSFLSEEDATPKRTYSGLRDSNDSRNETEIFDVNPTFTPPPPPPQQPTAVPVYAKVNKMRSNKTPPSDERPFSGIAQVYSPPPQYETEPPLPPDLPPELPPDIPPRETAESCARRLFYQEGCVPEDVSFTLASGVPFDVEVSRYYMQYFNFDNYKLDDAVRVFVERAPLIGENSTRERILFHLSKHLYDTNTALRQQLSGPEEIHTLVCALMMLNTDLHGGMVDRKMTYNQFENNLRNTDATIDRGTLKELYNGIKSKPIIINAQPAEPPKPLPTLEQYENVIHKQGSLVKKNYILMSGKRPGMFKRGWKRWDAELRGSKLAFSKGGKKMEIICHHCIASRTITHRNRHSVLLLVCADDRQFLLQAVDDTDLQEWMHAINKVAAMFSALPMAAPVSNSNKFQPHSLPMSRTRCSLEEQLQNHMTQVDKLTQEYDALIAQQSNQVAPTPEWHYKKRYLEKEKEKFEEYAHLLNTLLYPDSEESLMSPQSFGRATANRMSYKRAVQKNVTPVNV